MIQLCLSWEGEIHGGHCVVKVCTRVMKRNKVSNNVWKKKGYLKCL